MNKKQIICGITFTLGLFFVAGYSIDSHGFHSGIYGIVGCALLLVSYLGFFWAKIRTGDQHSRRLLYLLAGLLLLIIILDVIEVILS